MRSAASAGSTGAGASERLGVERRAPRGEQRAIALLDIAAVARCRTGRNHAVEAEEPLLHHAHGGAAGAHSPCVGERARRGGRTAHAGQILARQHVGGERCEPARLVDLRQEQGVRRRPQRGRPRHAHAEDGRDEKREEHKEVAEIALAVRIRIGALLLAGGEPSLADVSHG